MQDKHPISYCVYRHYIRAVIGGLYVGTSFYWLSREECRYQSLTRTHAITVYLERTLIIYPDRGGAKINFGLSCQLQSMQKTAWSSDIVYRGEPQSWCVGIMVTAESIDWKAKWDVHSIEEEKMKKSRRQKKDTRTRTEKERQRRRRKNEEKDAIDAKESGR